MLPNGKVLRYTYSAQSDLIRVDSLDPEEQIVYASIHIAGTPKQGITLIYHYLPKSNIVQCAQTQE